MQNANSSIGIAVYEEFIESLDILVVSSLDQMSAIKELPAQYPEKFFISIVAPSSYTLLPNIAYISPRLYQPRWLTGIICGHLTKSNKLGYLLPEKFGSIPNSLNAFYIGAVTANPQVKVYTILTNSFESPIVEKRAADLLLNMGVDCLVGQEDDNTLQTEAQNYNKLTIGYASDMRFFVGENVLTSILLNWGNFLIELTELAINGTWEGPYQLYYGIDKGATSLAPYSTSMPNWLIDIVNNHTAALVESDTIFCGVYAQALDPTIKYNCLNDTQIQSISTIMKNITLVASLTLSDVIEDVYVRWSSALGIVIATISSVLIFIGLLLILDFFWYRNAQIMRSASVLFCVLVVSGGILCYISCYFWIGRPTTVICMLRAWLSGIGFTITYSGILVKNWRILRLLHNEKLEILFITNKYLLLRGVAPMLAIELIILIVWTIIAPVHIETSSSPLLLDYQVQVVCTLTEKSDIMLGIFLGFKGVLVLLGVIVSYQNRNASTNFNESQPIALATYFTVLWSIVAIGLSFAISNGPSTDTVFPVFGLIIIITSTLGFLFFKKVYTVNIRRKVQQWDSNKISMKKRDRRRPNSASTVSQTSNTLSINWSDSKATTKQTESDPGYIRRQRELLTDENSVSETESLE